MKSIAGILLLFSIVGSAVSREDQYCSICADHTLCKYQGFGPACEDVGEGGVTEKDKELITDLHNYYRRLVAKGSESRGLGGAQPQAANLMKLSWDEELAKVAQTWADQCLFQHDTCRDVPRWKVGQNIYWSWGKPIKPEANWTAAVESWYEEVNQFNPNDVGRYKFDSSTGHFTQVIWHNTVFLGCGRRNYGPNKIYVCNYGPTGNWINDPIYVVGAPCSKCPQGTTCNDGLCEGTPSTPSRSGPSPSRGSQGRKRGPSQRNRNGNYISSLRKGHDPTANKLNQIDDETLPEEIPTTELPIELNIIDDLELINSDEEIKKEVDDLKKRILELTKKILEKRKAKN